MSFSKDFRWGAATASYQVEGAAYEDGKGMSVWDMMCKKPGAIKQGNTGDVACDHYHRYKEDVALMKEMGLRAYRLSISWPRVLPEGVGAVNAKGLDFYSRLIDELLAAGIEPWVTLFHWDYPLALYCRGGWLNSDSPEWFAQYAAICGKSLGDRVKHWMTHNEPLCFVGTGHSEGRHAPGDQLALPLVLRVGHNAMLAHGKGVQALRASCPGKVRVGLAQVACPRAPMTSSAADIEAARTATFSMFDKSHWNNSWWMDPVMLGKYPEDGLKMYGQDAPKVGPNDMATMCQPLDFFGANIYTCEYWRAGEDGKPQRAPLPTGVPITAIKWPVTQEALYWGPRFFYERYKLPIAITENGMSGADWVSLDGKVHDPQRIDYLHRHLRQLSKAADDGVPVEAYFQWSLMDNFEWAHGYSERFGMVYVDYSTQKRTMKDSAYWYKKVIQTNGAEL
jgi:beta-glucosidase